MAVTKLKVYVVLQNTLHLRYWCLKVGMIKQQIGGHLEYYYMKC